MSRKFHHIKASTPTLDEKDEPEEKYGMENSLEKRKENLHLTIKTLRASQTRISIHDQKKYFPYDETLAQECLADKPTLRAAWKNYHLIIPAEENTKTGLQHVGEILKTSFLYGLLTYPFKSQSSTDEKPVPEQCQEACQLARTRLNTRIKEIKTELTEIDKKLESRQAAKIISQQFKKTNLTHLTEKINHLTTLSYQEIVHARIQNAWDKTFNVHQDNKKNSAWHYFLGVPKNKEKGNFVIFLIYLLKWIFYGLVGFIFMDPPRNRGKGTAKGMFFLMIEWLFYLAGGFFFTPLKNLLKLILEYTPKRIEVYFENNIDLHKKNNPEMTPMAHLAGFAFCRLLWLLGRAALSPYNSFIAAINQGKQVAKTHGKLLGILTGLILGSMSFAISGIVILTAIAIVPQILLGMIGGLGSVFGAHQAGSHAAAILQTAGTKPFFSSFTTSNHIITKALFPSLESSSNAVTGYVAVRNLSKQVLTGPAMRKIMNLPQPKSTRPLFKFNSFKSLLTEEKSHEKTVTEYVHQYHQHIPKCFVEYELCPSENPFPMRAKDIVEGKIYIQKIDTQFTYQFRDMQGKIQTGQIENHQFSTKPVAINKLKHYLIPILRLLEIKHQLEHEEFKIHFREETLTP